MLLGRETIKWGDIEMARVVIRTEDEVRDSAKVILGLDITEPNIKQGTGQINYNVKSLFV